MATGPGRPRDSAGPWWGWRGAIPGWAALGPVFLDAIPKGGEKTGWLGVLGLRKQNHCVSLGFVLVHMSHSDEAGKPEAPTGLDKKLQEPGGNSLCSSQCHRKSCGPSLTHASKGQAQIGDFLSPGYKKAFQHFLTPWGHTQEAE